MKYQGHLSFFRCVSLYTVISVLHATNDDPLPHKHLEFLSSHLPLIITSLAVINEKQSEALRHLRPL